MQAYRGFESPPLSPPLHYSPLYPNCIRLFDSPREDDVTRDVAGFVCDVPLVSPRDPWVLVVGSEDGFARGKHMAGKLRPLDVAVLDRLGYSRVTVHNSLNIRNLGRRVYGLS